MNITQKFLDDTYKQYKHTYEGSKNDYFAALFMAKKHERDLETMLENCVFGNNDYGIDSYYFDKDAKNLYLYQFKWSNNHELFKESYKRLIDYGIERIFGDPKQDSLTNSCIIRLKYKLDEYSEIINKVYIRFVFNGDVEKAEKSKVLENLREDLETKKYYIDKFFDNRSIQFFVEYLSNETNSILQVSKTKKTHKYNFPFTETGKIVASNGETFYLGFLTLHDLSLMFQEMQLRLFEKNIRAGLNPDKAPNRAMKNTLKAILIDESLDPEYFSFNHNGVSLYAEHIEFEDGFATIVEPRVLNGAQSIVTLSRFLIDNDKNPALEKNSNRLRNIQVLAKIITNCKPDFITSVTIANNKQNFVDPINLRATDEIQFEFEDKFRNELGIFYERQEKAFESLNDTDLEDMGIFELKEINITKLAQTFLAVQGEIDRISRISEVFENDNYYKSCFKGEYIKCEATLIVLVYKIHYKLTSVIRDITEKGYQKYWWANKGKNLIWGLLVQAILNDKELDEWKEEHGKSLSVASNFSDYLKDIGSKKIRFILGELVQQKKYSDFMEQEQYAFFRTKVAYQEAMQIAKRKYGWEKFNLF